MAFDSDNSLYVVSIGRILIFTFMGYGAEPALVGTNPLGNALFMGLAADADGLVYVGIVQSGIGVYAKGKNWDFQLTATIPRTSGWSIVSKPPIVPPPVDCKGFCNASTPSFARWEQFLPPRRQAGRQRFSIAATRVKSPRLNTKGPFKRSTRRNGGRSPGKKNEWRIPQQPGRVVEQTERRGLPQVTAGTESSWQSAVD
jgi:hypothetical protein